MTDDLRSLVLISPGVFHTETPSRSEVVTEWVVDFDMLAVAALCLGGMVAIVWRRRWT